MTRPILIFANPRAGRGRGRDIADAIQRHLRQEGHPVRLITEPPASAPLPEQEIAAAIAIGGDGTLREVAARFYLHQTGLRPPLLVVPLGTANLMGRHLGASSPSPGVEYRVAEAIQRMRIRRCDAATANGGLFLLMASVGFDAQVVHEVCRRRRGPITKLSYVTPALAALRTTDFTPVEVRLDGQPVFGPAPAMVFIGNVPEYGTGFPILPHATPLDGLLDVCVMPCGSRGDLLRLMLLAAAGEHLSAEGVVYQKASRIEVASDRPVAAQIDGEAAGFTPLDVRLLPWQINFIVPPSP